MSPLASIALGFLIAAGLVRITLRLLVLDPVEGTEEKQL
jgi:hypothetical protein